MNFFFFKYYIYIYIEGSHAEEKLPVLLFIFMCLKRIINKEIMCVGKMGGGWHRKSLIFLLKKKTIELYFLEFLIFLTCFTFLYCF